VLCSRFAVRPQYSNQPTPDLLAIRGDHLVDADAVHLEALQSREVLRHLQHDQHQA
jgi:hypothetical protein